MSRWLHALTLFVVVFANVQTTASAADETFVGVLAYALDPEVVEEIGLSDSELKQLQSLVEDREAEALEMAMGMRDLSEDEQEKRLAGFRAKSEAAGLKLLSAKQRAILDKVRVRQIGMTALGEDAVVKMLDLTAEQRQEIADLLKARDEAMAKVGASKQIVVSANFDRQLKGVLSPSQTEAWAAITTPAGKKDDPAKKPKVAQRNTRPNRATPKSIPSGEGNGRLQFSFRYAPWQSVIEWFAEECELSLLMDAPPQGTFNYTDPREYTPAKAIDLLNSVLLTKGYTLVRREKILQVVNLEDGIPPNLVTEVPEDKLDEFGEYELVRCVFTLQSVNATEASSEIENLLGPQGAVNVLASSNQLSITETAGRLRTFRRILQQGEQQNTSALGQAQLVTLENVRSSQVIASWRKLMGLTEEENATADGSLRVTQGKTSKQLLVSGKPNSVEEFREMVKLLDVPAGGGARDVAQLEVYSVTEADPESVLNVVETLMEGIDEVRIAVDPKTGSLVALARPDEQDTIRATIKQMQSDRRQVEVIKLRAIDPQLAMLSIEKLFGPPPGSEEEGAAPSKAPIVDADPITRSLMIRGSESQIEDIRTLLSKMGEDSSAGESSGGRISGSGGNLRLIPIDAATARRAMSQLETIWPTVRKNQIRTVVPSARRIRTIRSSENDASETDQPSPLEQSAEDEPDVTRAAAEVIIEGRTLLVGAEPVNEPAEDETAGEERDALPEVIVTIGEQGLLIASEDTKALDEFEELFLAVSDRLFAGQRELTIFYLKYTKAEVASEFVKQFVAGASSGSSGGGGGTLLGSIASAALGGGGSGGGGIIGSLLGAGGGGGSSVSLSKGTSVIADPRLNALVVQATPKELDFIEELLRAIDRADSPEIIETVPRPRAIPVINTDAEEVADIVRSVYSTRLAGGQSGGRRREPSPEDFIRAMTGQKNAGKQINEAIGEQVGITISVDTRRNALIVIATESLFLEIKDLVSQLDFATPGLEEVVRYGTVTGSSPEIIRSALETLMDDESQSSNDRKSTKKNTSSGTQSQQPKAPGGDEIRRRMEFIKAMQKASASNNKAAKKKAAATRGKK